MLCLIIPPMCCEEKESKDEQLCIIVHTINNNIRDANPLDKSSHKTQLKRTALHNTMMTIEMLSGIYELL